MDARRPEATCAQHLDPAAFEVAQITEITRTTGCTALDETSPITPEEPQL